MVFTNAGRQFVALRLGSSLPDLYIQNIGIGTGSSTVSVSDTTLTTEANRTAITGSPDFTTDRTVSFQADFNSVQMSGINLTEFGLFDVASGTGFAGSAWQREGFGSVVFDGTNELQIVSTLQVLPSGTS